MADVVLAQLLNERLRLVLWATRDREGVQALFPHPFRELRSGGVEAALVVREAAGGGAWLAPAVVYRAGVEPQLAQRKQRVVLVHLVGVLFGRRRKAAVEVCDVELHRILQRWRQRQGKRPDAQLEADRLLRALDGQARAVGGVQQLRVGRRDEGYPQRNGEPGREENGAVREERQQRVGDPAAPLLRQHVRGTRHRPGPHRVRGVGGPHESQPLHAQRPGRQRRWGSEAHLGGGVAARAQQHLRRLALAPSGRDHDVSAPTPPSNTLLRLLVGVVADHAVEQANGHLARARCAYVAQ